MFKYFRYSNFKISFDLNPFVWSVMFHHSKPTEHDPKLHIFYLRILPLSFALIIDDGTTVFDELENDDVIGDDDVV